MNDWWSSVEVLVLNILKLACSFSGVMAICSKGPFVCLFAWHIVPRQNKT